MASSWDEALVEASQQLLVGLSSSTGFSALADDQGATIADELAYGLMLVSRHKGTMKDEIWLPRVWIKGLSIVMDEGCLMVYDTLLKRDNTRWTEADYFRFRWFQHLVNSASNCGVYYTVHKERLYLT